MEAPRLVRWVLVASCAAGIVACASGRPEPVYLHKAVNEGDSLVVERALRARGILSKEVYFRGGKPISFFSADRREIKCRLRIFNLPASNTVQRARYEIERVRSATYGGSSAEETDTVTRIDLTGAGTTSGGYFECTRTIDSGDFQSVPSYITLAETLGAVGPYLAFETPAGEVIGSREREDGGG